MNSGIHMFLYILLKFELKGSDQNGVLST